MILEISQRMDNFISQFNALGQEGRLEIFRLLVRAGPQGLCVDDIKRRVPMPGSTLSHHLDTLARSGLLAPRRSGRFIYHAVDWNQTAHLIRFLTEDCCADLHTRLAQTPAAAIARGGSNNAGARKPRGRVKPKRRPEKNR
ncbi:MAG TPA: metalloregulator ArsR/SmtB family transcription factor [Candidatus Binataceae bacterium]|nr:metalloregulator ArsR/SmtB family transcription factor [Candidatus Binataceae bacterium]